MVYIRVAEMQQMKRSAEDTLILIMTADKF